MELWYASPSVVHGRCSGHRLTSASHLEAGICVQPSGSPGWYRNAELTEAAKARFPFKKCCDHADVVKTRFDVNKTSNGDEWYWLDGEQWRRIPDDVIHWGRRAPGGQPTLFIYSGKETCFFPGDGGI
jgi:hypothetical protein